PFLPANNSAMESTSLPRSRLGCRFWRSGRSLLPGSTPFTPDFLARPSSRRAKTGHNSERYDRHEDSGKMATVAAAPPALSLNSPELKQKLQQIRQCDNLTNWYYLLRSWLFLAAVMGGTIYFALHYAEWGLNWAWNIPVVLVAIV